MGRPLSACSQSLFLLKNKKQKHVLIFSHNKVATDAFRFLTAKYEHYRLYSQSNDHDLCRLMEDNSKKPQDTVFLQET